MAFLRSALAALFALSFIGSAQAQTGAKTCPSGLVLANTFEHYFASGPNTWGQAILYWQDYGSAAVYHRTKIVRALLECYGPYCGMPDGDTSAHAALKTYHFELQNFKDGKRADRPAVPAALSAPPPVMLAWAEKRFGCKAGPTAAERDAVRLAEYAVERTRARSEAAAAAAKPKREATKQELMLRRNVVDDWEFYEVARFEGGPMFYRWWDANKKMRTVQDAYDMCFFHKPTSVECTAPRAWADQMSGKNGYWGSGPVTSTFNGPYTESYTDKYGYEGPARSGPANPPTNLERRCYDQGDGTEICFTD